MSRGTPQTGRARSRVAVVMPYSNRLASLSLIWLAACGAHPPVAPVANTGVTPPDPAACTLPPEPPMGPPATQCTEMGCTWGYRIWLDAPGGWRPGQYQFEITADGKHQTCTGAIPLAACGESSLVCRGDALVSIDELDCGDDISIQAFGGIAFDGMPCDVHVVISRDGAVLADHAARPAYGWFEPNGPSCGPRCLQAGEELTL